MLLAVMRNAFATALKNYANDDDIVFLTGDLGFGALESLRDAMGNRFINMGVAEPNMIGVAAGMASKGYKVFCYSIAPFIVFRALEQIRNDVSFHRLPVFIVGNGAGYGYGIMGATHHAIEDVAVMASLPDITCYLPAFDDDIEFVIQQVIQSATPAYIRLGSSYKFQEQPIFSALRCLNFSHQAQITVVGVGHIAQNVVKALHVASLQIHVDVFALCLLPCHDIQSVVESLHKTRKLLIIDEHRSHGSAGAYLLCRLAEHCSIQFQVVFLHAQGYQHGKYGSQLYHRQSDGIDVEGIISCIKREIEVSGV